MSSTDFKCSYIGKRKDILDLVPINAKKILDIGCSTGVIGGQIKSSNSAVVTGIEIDSVMGEVAKKILDKVVIGDVEKMDLHDVLAEDKFDCIIFADILEHLVDPWAMLKNIVSFLNKNGVIIASVPNVRHHSTITSLLFGGSWPYRERGIHDKAHLRFFTIKNIRDMFKDAGLEIAVLKRNYRLVEKSEHSFSKYFALPLIRDFVTFQYLIVGRKSDL